MKIIRYVLRYLNSKTYLRVLALSLFALGLFASCSGEGHPSPTPFDTLATPAGEIMRIDVNLHSYGFAPRTFHFSVGDTVEFVLPSFDAVHTFTVADLGINWVVPKGETHTHRVIFDRPGLFRIVCTIPQHEALGMTGTITVE